MTDIDKLEGTALSRAVAEALGWTITGPRPYYIRGPEGQEYTTDAVHMGLAWERAIYVHGYIPDFANDLNAAVGLPMDEYHITKHREFGIEASVNFSSFGHDDTTPATAICRAWLKYHAAREERDAAQDRRDAGRQGDKL